DRKVPLEPILLFGLFRTCRFYRQKFTTEHGHQRKSNEKGANKCKNDNQCQLLEYRSRYGLHKYDRVKYDTGGKSCGYNSSAHLAGAYECAGFKILSALFPEPDNIFEHDNSVVNNQADTQGESPKTHLVKSQAVKIEQGEGSDDRN